MKKEIKLVQSALTRTAADTQTREDLLAMVKVDVEMMEKYLYKVEERQGMIDDIVRYSDGRRNAKDLESLTEDELYPILEEELEKYLAD